MRKAILLLGEHELWAFGIVMVHIVYAQPRARREATAETHPARSRCSGQACFCLKLERPRCRSICKKAKLGVAPLQRQAQQTHKSERISISMLEARNLTVTCAIASCETGQLCTRTVCMQQCVVEKANMLQITVSRNKSLNVQWKQKRVHKHQLHDLVYFSHCRH